MLNEKKIRLMAKLNLFEEKEGKEAVKLDRFYRIDYIRYQILKTIFCVTIGYLIVLASVVIYRSEAILDKLTVIDYKSLASYILLIYVLLLIFYSFVTGVTSYFRYEKNRVKMKKYKKNLKALRVFYKEEGEIQ